MNFFDSTRYVIIWHRQVNYQSLLSDAALPPRPQFDVTVNSDFFSKGKIQPPTKNALTAFLERLQQLGDTTLHLMSFLMAQNWHGGMRLDALVEFSGTTSRYCISLITGLITGYARNVATFNSHQSAYILCYLLVCYCISCKRRVEIDVYTLYRPFRQLKRESGGRAVKSGKWRA